MDIKELRSKVLAADPHSKDCRKTVGFPILAWYLLKTCRQQTGQSLHDYFQKLKSLSMDCNFAAVSAIQHKEEAVRDAFISGITLPDIRTSTNFKKSTVRFASNVGNGSVIRHCQK